MCGAGNSMKRKNKNKNTEKILFCFCFKLTSVIFLTQILTTQLLWNIGLNSEPEIPSVALCQIGASENQLPTAELLTASRLPVILANPGSAFSKQGDCHGAKFSSIDDVIHDKSTALSFLVAFITVDISDGRRNNQGLGGRSCVPTCVRMHTHGSVVFLVCLRACLCACIHEWVPIHTWSHVFTCVWRCVLDMRWKRQNFWCLRVEALTGSPGAMQIPAACSLSSVELSWPVPSTFPAIYW